MRNTLLLLLALTFPQEKIQTPDPVEKQPIPLTTESEIFSHNVQQVTFRYAKEATILADEEGVKIKAVGLTDKESKGIAISFTGVIDPEIEVTTLVEFQGMTVGLYPPKNILPNKEGEYYIEGKPGDKFGIRARSKDGLRQVYAEIEGKPDTPTDPVEPPPSDSKLTAEDLAKITNISRKATALNDKVTQDTIREYLKALSLSEVVDEARGQIKKAIGKAFIDSMEEVDPPYKDWDGVLRQPLDKLLRSLEAEGKISTSKDLEQVVDAIVKGLASSQSVSIEPSTITVYTTSNCVYCDKWKLEVLPRINGWVIKEVDISEVEGMNSAPNFLMSENGKTSELVKGYMPISLFNEVVSKMRE